MATTSYTTNGQPVPAATTNPGSPSDYVQRSATGSGGAQTAQEGTYDAQRRVGNTDVVGGFAPRRWHCGAICTVALVVIAVCLLTGRGAS